MKKTEKYLTFSCLYVVIIVTIAQTVAAQDIMAIRDQEGNIYKTVQIGNKTWMTENLKTTKYNDGSQIPLITEKNKWIVLSTPAYCWYNNDTTYKNIYGALYNGYAVNTNKLCPAGWHVSTDAEWTELVDFLGGKNVAGAKLKDSGITQWSGPDSGATNETGFTALPGGTRYVNGIYFTSKEIGYWWTFTASDELNGWYRSMYYSNSIVDRNYHDSTNGFSVRCVKDVK